VILGRCRVQTLKDVNLPLDNTRSERALRKIVVARKAWMFYAATLTPRLPQRSSASSPRAAFIVSTPFVYLDDARRVSGAPRATGRFPVGSEVGVGVVAELAGIVEKGSRWSGAAAKIRMLNSILAMSAALSICAGFVRIPAGPEPWEGNGCGRKAPHLSANVTSSK
jgi:hypothetical protein